MRLRTQLLLVSLLTLALPWPGCQYVREMERAQLAAQLEPALGFVAEADVDDDELRQALPERLRRLAPRSVGRHAIAVTGERVRVVCADGGLVFDDGDVAAHCAFTLPQPRRIAPQRSSIP